jgi:hypothetical protein
MNCTTAFWKQITTKRRCDKTETGQLGCTVLKTGGYWKAYSGAQLLLQHGKFKKCKATDNKFIICL